MPAALQATGWDTANIEFQLRDLHWPKKDNHLAIYYSELAFWTFNPGNKNHNDQVTGSNCVHPAVIPILDHCIMGFVPTLKR